GGVDHDRGRTPALGGLRPPAHRGGGVAEAHRYRRRALARAVRRGVRNHLRRRRLLPRAPGPARNPRAAARGAPGPASGAPAIGRERRMTLDLVPIWTVILALSVFMYVLLDGFDLGVGILFP